MLAAGAPEKSVPFEQFIDQKQYCIYLWSGTYGGLKAIRDLLSVPIPE